MRLRVRLALSYLAVIALFLLVISLGWVVFGGGRAVGQAHRELAGLVSKLAWQAAALRREQGPEAMRDYLRRVPLPDGSSLTLFGDPPEAIQGEPLPPEPAYLGRARAGETVELLQRRRVRYWLPLDGEVLALSMPGAVSVELRNRAAEALAPAVLIAALSAFAAGLGLANLIARPVSQLAEATEALGRDDLGHRIEVSGRGELAELAQSFNRMAATLQESRQREREFLADVSHNLKTPLAAIQGWTEALQDDLVPGEEKTTLARILRETRFVAQTVQRLLDLSRWESGRPLIHWEELPLSEPLMEAVDSLADSAERARITLGFAGLEAGLRVRGDRGKLRELFQILLENAVQHGGEGTHVEVAVRQGQRTEVEVRDNGQGMDLEALGDPRSRYRSGLGLAIAHKLAEAHGGSLQLQSAPGEGTRVQFDLTNC